MKHKIALGCSLAALLALAGPARAASPDSAPPVGRSLFDLLVAKKMQGGSYVLDVPFPYENLVKMLAAKAQGTAPGTPVLPAIVLIPNGRSLQKDHTDAANPRAVLGFTEHPPKSNDVSLTLRDRLFVGYAAKGNQLEVISFNEEAGRFEYQIVADYREGGLRQVYQADRSLCVQCHKAQAPIFPKNTWDETNANAGVVGAMMGSTDNSATFFGIVPTRGNKGTAYSIDVSTDRAGRLLSLTKVWKDGCKNVGLVTGLPAGFKSEDCRAHVFMFGVAAAMGIEPGELSANENGYAFVPYEKIAEIWKKNLTEQDLRFYLGDVANRNPSGFSDFQILQMPNEADRIALWKKNLAADKVIDEEHDPKSTPLTAYPYVDGIDPSKQSLDLTISQVSGLISPSERVMLPKDAAQFKAKFQANFKALAANAAAFGEAPLRKGAVMAPLMQALGVTTLAGQPVTSSFYADTAKLPPVQVDEGLSGTHTAAGIMINKYCGTSCHAKVGFNGNLDFLVREPGTSDKELWFKIVKRVQGKPCFRLDWNQAPDKLPVMQRMPRGPEMQNLVKAEMETGTSDRKFLMDTYRDKLLGFAADPEAQAAIGLSSDALKAIAATCNWTKYNGP